MDRSPGQGRPTTPWLGHCWTPHSFFELQELFFCYRSLIGNAFVAAETRQPAPSTPFNMASKLHINKPYVLKTLSHPLDRPDGPGRHTVGEVFGQKQASKRRKRSELSVSIDGDAIHLYDVGSTSGDHDDVSVKLTASRSPPPKP